MKERYPRSSLASIKQISNDPSLSDLKNRPSTFNLLRKLNPNSESILELEDMVTIN